MELVAKRFSPEDERLVRVGLLGSLFVVAALLAPVLVPVAGMVYTVWKATGVRIPNWVAAALIAATAAGVIVGLLCMWTGVGVAEAAVLVKVILSIGSVSG